MKYFYLISFVTGVLLAVRLLFFGAERRKRADVFPLRRSEPAALAFLLASGIAGYVMTPSRSLSAIGVLLASLVIGAAAAAIFARLAIATARIRPEHATDDPRFAYQGRVAVVSAAIPSGGVGEIRLVHEALDPVIRARDGAGAAIGVGEEVCIERVDDGIAIVERWSLVEARL